MEISGQSFGAYGNNPHVISLNGKCHFDVATNSIHVVEGGLVMAKVMEKPLVEKEAQLMYNGKSHISSPVLRREKKLRAICKYYKTLFVLDRYLPTYN